MTYNLLKSLTNSLAKIRSSWVDWTLRYQPFLDYVPGVLLLYLEPMFGFALSSLPLLLQ